MQQRTLTIRLIWLAMGASLLLPFLLFAVASYVSYRHTEDLTIERLVRSLDIEQQEAQKTFLLINHSLDDASDIVAGLSAEQIRAQQQGLYPRLKKLVADLPVAQSIWIYDTHGDVLVCTTVQPAPPDNFADRDFIGEHVAGNAGTYIGQVYQPLFGPQPFFTVSRGFAYEGSLEGVLEVSVPPSNFFRFYATMAYAPGLQYALIRDDGTILARYPAAPPGTTNTLDENSGFRRMIAEAPAGGIYTAASPLDGIEQRTAIRRLPGAPLYVFAGVSTTAIRNEWIRAMAPHLIFGIPATLLLFLTLFAVLRRTQRLYAEMDQRAVVEESLRQAQKMEAIGQLTGGVAHDFNNLLTIILGNLEMAKKQLADWTDPAHTKLAKRIESAMQGATRAAALTKRLLAFSRQQTLSPMMLDVNRLLIGLADFLQRAIGEDISLEIVGGAGVWQVEADQTELEAVILNLAVNARDAMPEGGKLTIETSNSYMDDAYCRQNAEVRPGQYVLIAVSDTGVGMAPEVIDRAFDPFFTTKQAGHGTGLGLSQVYGFVKQSGGHVKIYSEVGEGTTIKVYLRRLVGPGVPAPEATPELSRGRLGETILVAEDDAEVRGYVLETLQGLGYNVVGAAGADEALLVMGQCRIDLLLTDVVMPGVNGRKLAEAAQQRHPDLKVLFMTGYSRNAIVHQGRLDPGVALIQKPLTGELLAAMVRKILDGHAGSGTAPAA
jgi:two-component system, NtrC family, sensor kinase